MHNQVRLNMREERQVVGRVGQTGLMGRKSLLMHRLFTGLTLKKLSVFTLPGRIVILMTWFAHYRVVLFEMLFHNYVLMRL